MKNYYTHNRNYEKFDKFVEILFMFSIIFFTISVTFVNTLLLIYKPIEIEDVFLNKIQQMSYTENVTSNAVPAISVKEIIEQQENSNDIVEEETIPYEEYIIQRGDNLWNISRKYYGDGNYYTWIEKCNDLYGNNRNLIKGQVLKIYPLDYNITTEEIEQNGVDKEQSLRSPYLSIPDEVDYSTMTYYGNIHITGYDPLCSHCCGKSNGITASGDPAEYYKTVACNSLPFGTEIYIEGYGYFIVNDRGGSNLGIDIACESHTVCALMSDPGRDIYIVNK